MSSDSRDRPLRLSDRETGAQFCAIERSLLFDPAYENVGWAHYIASGTVVLHRSKFTEQDRGIVYVLPDDIAAKVEEGDLVSFSGKAERRVVKDPGQRGPMSFSSRRYFLVEGSAEARLPAVPPELPKDEFLYRASAQWRGADLDMLDIVIALELLSAPPSVYGRGGIGSEGLESFRERGAGTPLDVATTILDMLPVEFRAGSPVYRFEALDTLSSMRAFRKVRSREANFSIVAPHRVTEAWSRERPPVQLPFVLRDSRWNGVGAEPDLDVLDYQLCALYQPLPEAEDVLPLAMEAARRAHSSELFDFPSRIEVDPLSGARVALSIMRLNIGKEFKGGRYMRRPLATGEGMKVLEELLRRGLEEVRRKAGDEDLFRRDRSMPFRDKLNQNDRELYSAIRRIVEEEGIQEVPVERVLPKKGRTMAEASIANLNRYGYLLLMKGGTSLRLVDLDAI